MCYKNALGFAIGSFWFLYLIANHTPIISVKLKKRPTPPVAEKAL